MSEIKPYERYKKDKSEKDELEIFKKDFYQSLQGVGEPKPDVKWLRPIKESFNASTKDSSILRFSLFLDPKLRINAQESFNATRKKEGKPPLDLIEALEAKDEKDYISGWDEIRKGVEAGSHDFVHGVGTILFAGTDLATNTDFLTKFDKMMENREPSQPETWRGDLTALMVQFGIPGGVIQKVVNRTKTAGRLKKTVEKIKNNKLRKVSTVAVRALEGATVVGATDFLASEPGRDALFADEEDTRGLKGKKKAAATLRNKLKYGAEGTIIGGGFPLIGKAAQLTTKYAKKGVIYPTVGYGAKAINQLAIKPATYVLARTPGVKELAKGTQYLTDFTLRKVIAPTIVSAFSRKIVTQLPPFDQWRLHSATDPDIVKRTIKNFDSFLAAFRSYGRQPKDIEGVSEKVNLFIKSRAKKFDKLINDLDRKAYDLAKKFENQHNKTGTSLPMKKYYLDEINEFLLDQKKLDELLPEFRELATDLKTQIGRTMEEFKKNLPKGKDADEIAKDLQRLEVSKLHKYMVRSFATFSNPEYVPDKIIKDKAVDWIVKNFVKKSKSERATAIESFPTIAKEKAYRNYAENIAEDILNLGRTEGRSPLSSLKDIGKKIALKNYKTMRTGEELPDVVQQLLGKEKNLKNSVLYTVTDMIAASANKRAADLIAKSGLKNGWLFKSREAAIARGFLSNPRQTLFNPKGDIEKIGKVPRLGTLKSELTELFTAPEYQQMFRGTGGVLDKLVQNAAYRHILQIKVGIQAGKTLLSPQTQVRNVTSASFFALMNGHIGGNASVVDAMRITLRDIFKGGKGINEVDFQNYVEKLVKLGVWDENVVASELKAVMQNIKDATPAGPNTFDELFEKLIKLAPMDKVAKVYAGGDNLWKHFGFEYDKSQLALGLKNLDDVKTWFKHMGEDFAPIDEVTGNVKTFEDAIEEAAAYLLRNTYPTYSKVPPFIQTIRKFPIGNFVAFPAEILRTGANIINIGLRLSTHSNPAIRQIGIRRLSGALMTSYAIGKGVTEISQFMTNTTDSQWDAYKRSTAATWNKASNLLAIKGWKDGESAAINFSYFSPYDGLFRPLEAAIANAEAQNLNPQETEAYVLNLMFSEGGPVKTLLDPFISQPIGYDRFLDVTLKNGKKTGGGSVYTESDDLSTKFYKSFIYVLEGVAPGVITSGMKIEDAIAGDLKAGGRPALLMDELLALLAGTRIIRIDVKKDLPYFVRTMNARLRAVDETENFYTAENFQNKTPSDTVNTYKQMQEEAFKIQKDMYIRIKDLELLDVDQSSIYQILLKQGVPRTTINNLLVGKFTPVNYSKARFENKVAAVEAQMDKLMKDNPDYIYLQNREFIFPQAELEELKGEYTGKDFFEETYNKETKKFEGGYNPEKEGYQTDDKGNLIFDSKGNPIPEEGFLQRNLKKIVPTIKNLSDRFILPGGITKINTPPLPNTPQPIVRNTQANVNPNTNLTRTQTALLSPSEQVIASRKT
jgi:hypothetical protein